MYKMLYINWILLDHLIFFPLVFGFIFIFYFTLKRSHLLTLCVSIILWVYEKGSVTALWLVQSITLLLVWTKLLYTRIFGIQTHVRTYTPTHSHTRIKNAYLYLYILLIYKCGGMSFEWNMMWKRFSGQLLFPAMFCLFSLFFIQFVSYKSSPIWWRE